MVPVFPLPGCVLFPGVVIPLHVFEPRYRAMMDSVVAMDDWRRHIALALLRRDLDEGAPPAQAPIHDVVCIGRVIEHERLFGGRYNLMLLGFSRARIVTEDYSRSFRRAELCPVFTEHDLPPCEADDIRKEIHQLLEELSSLHPHGNTGPLGLTVYEKLIEGGADLATLIDLLTYHLLPGEDSYLKHRVLEDLSLRVRAQILTRWLRSDVRAQRAKASEAESAPSQINLN